MSEQRWRVEFNNTDDRWVITDESGAVRFTGTTEYALTTLAFRLQEQDRIQKAAMRASESVRESLKHTQAQIDRIAAESGVVLKTKGSGE